jgi:hypothetical protein
MLSGGVALAGAIAVAVFVNAPRADVEVRGHGAEIPQPQAE